MIGSGTGMKCRSTHPQMSTGLTCEAEPDTVTILCIGNDVHGQLRACLDGQQSSIAMPPLPLSLVPVDDEVQAMSYILGHAGVALVLSGTLPLVEARLLLNTAYECGVAPELAVIRRQGDKATASACCRCGVLSLPADDAGAMRHLVHRVLLRTPHNLDPPPRSTLMGVARQSVD